MTSLLKSPSKSSLSGCTDPANSCDICDEAVRTVGLLDKRTGFSCPGCTKHFHFACKEITALKQSGTTQYYDYTSIYDAEVGDLSRFLAR